MQHSCCRTEKDHYNREKWLLTTLIAKGNSKPSDSVLTNLIPRKAWKTAYYAFGSIFFLSWQTTNGERCLTAYEFIKRWRFQSSGIEQGTLKHTSRLVTGCSSVVLVENGSVWGIGRTTDPRNISRVHIRFQAGRENRVKGRVVIGKTWQP